MIKHSIIVLAHLLMPFSAYSLFTDERGDALIYAIRIGNIERVNKALQDGASVNYLEGFPLILALENNRDAIALRLIEAGADVHLKEDEAFLIAISRENLNMVKLLLARGAQINRQSENTLTRGFEVLDAPNEGYGAPSLARCAMALEQPAHNPQLHSHGFEIMKELLKRGADTLAAYKYADAIAKADGPDKHTYQVLLRYLAFKKNYIAIKCKELKDNKYSRACNPEVTDLPYGLWLILPARRNHENCSHQTPFIWACALAHEEDVKALLNCGLPKSYSNARDIRGYTALMYAAKHNHSNIIKLLATNDLRDKNGRLVLTNNVTQYIEALIEATKENNYILATEIFLFLIAPNFGKQRSIDFISPPTKE